MKICLREREITEQLFEILLEECVNGHVKPTKNTERRLFTLNRMMYFLNISSQLLENTNIVHNV